MSKGFSPSFRKKEQKKKKTNFEPSKHWEASWISLMGTRKVCRSSVLTQGRRVPTINLIARSSERCAPNAMTVSTVPLVLWNLAMREVQSWPRPARLGIPNRANRPGWHEPSPDKKDSGLFANRSCLSCPHPRKKKKKKWNEKYAYFLVHSTTFYYCRCLFINRYIWNFCWVSIGLKFDKLV